MSVKYIKELGHGSYGNVYMATLSSGRFVARKVYKKKKYYEKELDIVKNLDHPHIIQWVGKGFDPNKGYFLDFEVMNKGDLNFLAYKGNGLINEEKLWKWIIDALFGIDYLNKLAISHFDIKPSNLLIDAIERLKIGDLGLARNPLSIEITGQVGTTLYTPPELFSKLGTNYSVDIWGLGVSLHEICSKRNPFGKSNEDSSIIKGKVVNDEVPKMLHGNFIPTMKFESFVYLLLTKDPAIRPSASILLNFPFIRSKFTERCDPTWRNARMLSTETDRIKNIEELKKKESVILCQSKRISMLEEQVKNNSSQKGTLPYLSKMQQSDITRKGVVSDKYTSTIIDKESISQSVSCSSIESKRLRHNIPQPKIKNIIDNHLENTTNNEEWTCKGLSTDLMKISLRKNIGLSTKKFSFSVRADKLNLDPFHLQTNKNSTNSIERVIQNRTVGAHNIGDACPERVVDGSSSNALVRKYYLIYETSGYL